MKKRFLLLAAISVISLFASCDYERPELLPVRQQPEEPEVPQPETPEPPTAAEFRALHEAALESRKQEFTFTVDGNTNIELTSEKGVHLSIYTGCLTKNGAPVTGEIKVEYVELFDRSQMLVTNKPTMGIMPNGDRGAMVSGGEFYINATQDGVQLQTNCGMQLSVPASLTGGGDNAMTMWYGLVDEFGNLVWEDAVQNNPQQEVGVWIDGGAYNCFFGNFGWTNIDRFYDDPRPKTTIHVDVPEGYDDTNSMVFLAYVGEPNLLARLDVYDPNTALFSEHYGLIPIGLECHIIFVSENDGDYIYAIKSVTIAADDIITITDADLNTITEAQLIAAINALP